MRLSQHFSQRQKERNITDKEVFDAVIKGVRLNNRHDSSKWTFVNNEAGVLVVTDKEMTTLITTFRKG